MRLLYWIFVICLTSFIHCRIMQRINSIPKDGILETILIDGIERKYIVYLPKTKILAEEKSHFYLCYMVDLELQSL